MVKKYVEIPRLSSKHCTCKNIREKTYLFPSEHVTGQFDHSEVPTAQRLVQVVEASNLPIVMTFEPRHSCWRTDWEKLPSVACLSSISSPSPPRQTEVCGRRLVDSRPAVCFLRGI